MLGIVLYQILRGLVWILQIFSYALLIRAFLSWVIRPDNPIYRFFYKITEPFVALFRPLAMRLTGNRLPIDISFLLCYLAIYLLQRVLYAAMAYCFYL